MSEKDDYNYEAILKFRLPLQRDDFDLAMNGLKYSVALHEIYEKCRTVWKYEEAPHESKVKLAEEIADMVNESGAME